MSRPVAFEHAKCVFCRFHPCQSLPALQEHLSFTEIKEVTSNQWLPPKNNPGPQSTLLRLHVI